MSINSVILSIQGPTGPQPVSTQKNLTTGFSTESCFGWLHNQNVAFRMNIRGMVNHEYNRLLTEKGLAAHSIPGGENLEELGMNKTTSIVRPDLYFQACQKVMSSHTSTPFSGLNLSTATFFNLLHHENVKCSANVRGLVNQRYNELLSEAGFCEGKIPGDDLHQLGMDDRTALRPAFYLKAYAEVIAGFENKSMLQVVETPQFESFLHLDILEYLTKNFLEAKDVCHAAEVSKQWHFSMQHQGIYFELFLKNKIPFVECINNEPRNYKEDFKVLYPMTINGRMSERLFGKIVGEIPLISAECFKRCSERDLFEPQATLMSKTFTVVVFPDAFERTSCDEFPFVVDEKGDLVVPLESDDWKGKTLQIPNKPGNLMILCENPLAGKENMPVFGYFNDEVLKQCNTCSNKVSLYFMRTCIADETRDMPYPSQKALVESHGFEVTPLGVRTFFDAVCILTSGTCPDARVPRSSYARTSDIVVEGNNVYQLVIGGFAPGSGADVDSHDFYCAHDSIGVAPGGPAEVPRTLALGTLELGKGH